MEETFSDIGNHGSNATAQAFLEPWLGKAILLVDLDAFFAAVEQLDHPAWRGKPLIVGGDADRRGVVATASYEARKFGIRSAMPSSTAAALCPEAIWTHGNYRRYQEMSQKVMDILYQESPFIQQVSIDEAFLDISPTAHNTEHPVLVAARIHRGIEKLGITASIGLSTSKTVAKIASEMDKPRGLTVVYPGRERDFLFPLPIRHLSGIGPVAQHELFRHNIETIGDLANADPLFIERIMGKNGRTMHLRANGGDDSPVVSEEEAKSVSHELSFAKDLTKTEEVEAAIAAIASKVGRRLRHKGLRGQSLSLKLRYDDRSLRSVQCRLPESSDDELAFTPLLLEMLGELWKPGVPIRLLGVSMSGFGKDEPGQERLFDIPSKDSEGTRKPLIEDAEKRSGLLRATDTVRDRFGESALQFGHELKTKDRI
ncbi:MAG: DNA polymerase IV [Eggerthellaceae bacterium]|nr:DNA polymerase IV [Eggerthellaceae bacterium]